MIKNRLAGVNYVIAAAFVFLLLFTGFVEYNRPEIIPLQEVKEQKTALPKSFFAQAPEAYHQIGEPLLDLQYFPPRMELPDLKQKINYYGQNHRPDAGTGNSRLHFNLATGETASISPKEPLYLSYDKGEGGGKYHFSPQNKETSLWIEAVPGEKEATLLVKMYDENGKIVTTPEANASFAVKEKEFARFGGQPWEIGKWRVDGTLLARQRARWFGVDKFLERHGGDEFKEKSGKNRIDFGDQDDRYSLYVNEGSALIWDGVSWKQVEPGEASRGFPLLLVKRVDERLMYLELWDPDGKKNIALNLLKTADAWTPQNLQQEFKFLGARTRSQYVFEVGEEKMLLSPDDWLLLTEEGWVKLDSIDGIDKYVDLKDPGTLFVFDGINRVGDQQVLKGELFNPTRTKVHDIEIPVQKDGLVFQHIDKEKKAGKANGFTHKAPLQYANGFEKKRDSK